jgi:hypothetical protein
MSPGELKSATLYHVALDVRAFLRTSRAGDYERTFVDDRGRPMPPLVARDYLLRELAKGHRYLPIYPVCDHFTYEHGCGGHPL